MVCKCLVKMEKALNVNNKTSGEREAEAETTLHNFPPFFRSGSLEGGLQVSSQVKVTKAGQEGVLCPSPPVLQKRPRHGC